MKPDVQFTNRAHICLAALKAVAFQSAEMVAAVEHDMSQHATKVQRIKVGKLLMVQVEENCKTPTQDDVRKSQSFL